MSKKQSTTSSKKDFPGFTHQKSSGGIDEYVLNKNGLRVLLKEIEGTGVVTTNITYLVGAKDEGRGETGLAHMLEHMLFKPTTFDVKANRDSASMLFERETGCILNANTWKDRTTYYFSYPREHLSRALLIEAQRMTGVVLTDDSLAPERNNVLSEFDMNNGDPHFALAVEMVGTAYHSHPYGHETIGYREDIEAYTTEKLERFYKAYYRPDNAIMMVIGDFEKEAALSLISKHFGKLPKPNTPIPRYKIKEFKQEGIRRTTIERPSQTNILSIGFKHAGYPSLNWFTASLLVEVLTGGEESVLHKALVDTGLASSVDGMLEPTSLENLGVINVTLTNKAKHSEVENKILDIIKRLTAETINPLLTKTKAKILTADLFARESSLKIAAELTEHVSAGDWTIYTKTPAILAKISPTSLLDARSILFNKNNLTIGYFIGTKN